MALNATAKISVDVQLAVGGVQEVVEVRASTSQVQAETPQVGRTIESRQIQDLTLNGRNPIFLALLKPGVRGGSIGSFDPDSVTNGGFSINGSRHVRPPAEEHASEPGLLELGCRPAQELPGDGSAEAAVPVGDLQPAESSQLGRGQRQSHQWYVRPGQQQERQPRDATGSEIHFLIERRDVARGYSVIDKRHEACRTTKYG